MNLIFRLIQVAVAALFRSRLSPLGESVTRFTVLPTDLDLNGHMNNGRYLTIMDLGRVDLLLRTGVVGAMRRNRWAGVVASVAIRYRRALNPFQRYDLRTRLVGWDERWFFMEQRFTRRGELCAYGIVKIQFAGRGRRVAPQEMADAIHPGAESPPLPRAVRDWQDSEDRLVSGQEPAPALA
ncbi:acyl-CoA thioesterase [Longimicrobium sp.]|uniref:acyl-CoA thioesterase n=1 Tax=Longimicrobium sp. TaxID=2029185 RepID=UPI002C903C6E|nr:acyl-CoA thioesterase [Longimicrobium sp.]HSU15143.1 acyl-CoA thioesterase [Longimicrobium sp.]